MAKIVFIIFCSITLVSCINNNNSNNHDGHNHDEHRTIIPLEVVLKKARQSAGSGFRRGGADNNICAKKCFNDVDDAISNDPDMMDYINKQRMPFRFENRFNPTKLNKLCGLLNQTFTCLEPCSSGEAKDFAEANLVLARYVCIDSTLLKNAPCIYKVNKESMETCTNQCSAQNTSLEAALCMVPSEDEYITIMQKSCEYMDCDASCDHEKLNQECGSAAVRDFNGFYQKSVEATQAMLRVYGQPLDTPSECNSIGIESD